MTEDALDELFNRILSEEKVQVALPAWFERPELLVERGVQTGPLGESSIEIRSGEAYPVIKILACVFVDISALELILRHELAHQLEMQRGERFDHGLGFKAILYEIYGNDHAGIFNGSPEIEKERRYFGSKR